MYILGDFNVDFLVPTTPLYNKLLFLVSSSNLTQVVTEPTPVSSSSSTLIEYIINPLRMRSRVTVVCLSVCLYVCKRSNCSSADLCHPNVVLPESAQYLEGF